MAEQDTPLNLLIPLKAPVPYKFSKVIPLHCADPALLYGVELEIENTAYGEWVVPGLVVTEDGSLRNGGAEYITSPMTYSNLMYCLDTFFTKAGVSDRNYSERCSVHVHANCQDLSINQIKTVLVLYQVFERIFFHFAGEERDKNIFCVPWDQTLLNHNVINSLSSNLLNVRAWQKYTALNLLPLTTQGTVEFRHLPGMYNLPRLGTWFNMIGCLFRYARQHNYNDVVKILAELNTVSNYHDIFNRVMGDFYPPEERYPDMVTDIENGVLNMKYSMLEPKTKPGLAKTDTLLGLLDEAPPPQPLNAWFIQPRNQNAAELRGARPVAVAVDDAQAEREIHWDPAIWNDNRLVRIFNDMVAQRRNAGDHIDTRAFGLEFERLVREGSIVRDPPPPEPPLGVFGMNAQAEFLQPINPVNRVIANPRNPVRRQRRGR